MKHEDFLNKDYYNSVALVGIQIFGLDSENSFANLSNQIHFLNYPKQYKCMLNSETYQQVNILIKRIVASFNQKVTAEVNVNFTSMAYGGVDYFFEENTDNDFNILIPLNLLLVKAENSIIVHS